MKEFMNTLKQTFRVGWGAELAYSAIAAVAGIVGVIVVLIVMAVDNSENSYATGGAMLALIAGIMILLFGGVFSLQQDFNIAISMGKIRKYYVPAKYVLLVVACSECMLVAAVIGWLEERLYMTLHPGAVCELSMSFLYEIPAIAVGCILIIPMIIMLCGALFMKYGMKFFWVAWAFWMIGCVVIPRMVSDIAHAPDSFLGQMGKTVIDFFTQLTTVQLVVGVGILWLIGLVVSFMLLRKQGVTA